MLVSKPAKMRAIEFIRAHSNLLNSQVPIVIAGDLLPCLSELSSGTAPELRPAVHRWQPAEHPVAAVIGVDASGARTRRMLDTSLRAVAEQTVSLAAILPRLRQVVIVLSNPPGTTAAVRSRADQAANNIHERIAREQGTYVVVTFVVIAEGVDASLLADRLRSRAAQAPASDAACALSWDEIRSSSIEFAAMNQYV